MTTTTAERRQPKRVRPPGFLVYMSLEERQQLHSAAAARGVAAAEYVRQLVARDVRQQLKETATNP